MIISVPVLINRQAMGTSAIWHTIAKQQKDKSIHYFILGVGLQAGQTCPAANPMLEVNFKCSRKQLFELALHLIVCVIVRCSSYFVASFEIGVGLMSGFRDRWDDCKFCFMIYLGAVEQEIVAFLLYYYCANITSLLLIKTQEGEFAKRLLT